MSNGHREVEMALPPLIRRENLSARVATILKRYILAEHLEPGHRLPAERRLADWLNVSRVVLREALSQLMGEGILERPSPYVLCVASFDRAKLAADLSGLDHEDAEANDLIQLRVVLELGAIDAIVAGATEAHLQAIECWVIEGERTLAAGDPIFRADAGFHVALLKSLDNQVINSFLPLIEEHLRHDILRDARRLTTGGLPTDQRVVQQHREIYEAINRRDPVASRHWILTHLRPYIERGRRDAPASDPYPSDEEGRTPLGHA
jgi:GntR family transcriptional repressor for pyruvate dehydrogenase complex